MYIIYLLITKNERCDKRQCCSTHFFLNGHLISLVELINILLADLKKYCISNKMNESVQTNF